MIYDAFGLRAIVDYQRVMDQVYVALSTFPHYNTLSMDAQGSACKYVADNMLGVKGGAHV